MTTATGGGKGPSLPRAVRPFPSSINAAARRMPMLLFPPCPSGSLRVLLGRRRRRYRVRVLRGRERRLAPYQPALGPLEPLHYEASRHGFSRADSRWMGGIVSICNYGRPSSSKAARLDVCHGFAEVKIDRWLVAAPICRQTWYLRLDSNSVRVSLHHKNVYPKHDRGGTELLLDNCRGMGPVPSGAQRPHPP